MPRNILIVDPSYTCRWLLASHINHIEPQGIVHIAVNGLDATDIVRNVHPDILITSINLDKLSGLTLLKKIYHKNPVNPAPQVIIMHEFNRNLIVKSLPDMNLLGFLDKPPELESLKKIWPSGGTEHGY